MIAYTSDTTSTKGNTSGSINIIQCLTSSTPNVLDGRPITIAKSNLKGNGEVEKGKEANVDTDG